MLKWLQKYLQRNQDDKKQHWRNSLQEQIERFSIEKTPKTINKIRIKYLRVLRTLHIWDNADTQLIGRKQTKYSIGNN